VPRNVVTLVPRRLVLPTRANLDAARKIEAAVIEQFRGRLENRPRRIEIDFSKRRTGVRYAVAAELDRIDPQWRRLFKLYGEDVRMRPWS
jgi:hypothetical protein